MLRLIEWLQISKEDWGKLGALALFFSIPGLVTAGGTFGLLGGLLGGTFTGLLGAGLFVCIILSMGR